MKHRIAGECGDVHPWERCEPEEVDVVEEVVEAVRTVVAWSGHDRWAVDRWAVIAGGLPLPSVPVVSLPLRS